MNKWLQRFNVLIIGIIIGGLCVTNYTKAAAMPNLSIPTAVQDEGASLARNTFVVQAVKKVGPAVVGITNKAYMRDNFDQKVLVEKGVGSGVIFDSNGYIATNYHVVDGAQEIVVSLTDGRTLNGKVLGVDPATDLAVVKVDATGLPAVEFGNSDSLMAGEPAIAIGNPLGLEFRGSVTVGVISALNRTIEVGDRKFKLIQTDAAINPGNSGGALVNADGEVVGINSVKISAAGVEGMGFSIPINSTRPILQSLVEKGKVSRAYLGVAALDRESALRYSYNVEIDHGVYVTRVEKGGPADQADIQQGDIIEKVNSTIVNSVADLRAVLDNVPVGSTVDVEITRNGKNLTMHPVAIEMSN
ncbi:Putative serine protease HtrA [Sporomusa silvacetica DSM 10669]|uniref:Serine protease HtrA n=1 Tax=Sporomusa silvacetica DSM 10669 TaxID=1123289 RepID=A0ABZ3IM67_9FIRM|nr:trypsin-like peptidase domain-containing protein [Sporomusa silvacetica]OZC15733.1 putative serine protease HtrA [Sporomusa silvacetica DSM 10669]